MARSDNWRINKSSIMAVEGAQLLKALQKVAGAAGIPKGFKVKFATDSQGSGIDFERKEVVIGAGKIFKEAPLSPDNMDILVGLALHEVGHQQIGTSRVWSLLREGVPRGGGYVSKEEVKLFQKFINIGEDIAIESKILSNSNLADYQKTLHKWAVTQVRDARLNDLMELWIEYALVHKVDALLNLPKEMNDAMSQLVALTGWLRHTQSYDTRALAYEKYWVAVKDVILNPPKLQEQSDAGADGNKDSVETPPAATEPSASAPDKDSQEVESNEPKLSEQPEESTEKENGDETTVSSSADTKPDDEYEEVEDAEPDEDISGGNGAGAEEGELERPLTPCDDDNIDEALAQAIEDAVQSDSEDVTEQVRAEFGEEHETVRGGYSVVRSRETKTPLIKPDRLLCKRLERIMTIRKRLQARIMRGEYYGKIDKRHLSRYPTDGRVFSLKYKFPDGFPNTKILIDLSGSMSGRESEEVLEAAGALQTLVNAEVWCYNRTGSVNLVRVDDGKLIHQFEPGGNTPSGLAIVGVSVGMKHGGLVIHLTDGEHNTGQMPWNAHWVLKKRGIELVNLIWGSSTSNYDYEGMKWKKLAGLAEFPDALYQILIEQAKLGSIGGKK